MLAGVLPRMAGALAQRQVIAAGLLAGFVAGVAIVALQPGSVGVPALRAAALYECPGSTRVITTIEPSANVLVIARSADGGWLQVYVGSATVKRAWSPASQLRLPSAPSTLPIVGCTAPSPTPFGTKAQPSTVPSVDSGGVPSAAPPSGAPATGAPSGAVATASPGASSAGATAAATAGPSVAPTATLTPTPAPTPPTGPTLSGFYISAPDPDPYNANQYDIYYPACPGSYPSTARLWIAAIDPDGIASVTLYYHPAGWPELYANFVDDTGGWFYVDVTADVRWDDGLIPYYVEAIDGVGDPAKLNAPASYQLNKEHCPE